MNLLTRLQLPRHCLLAAGPCSVQHMQCPPPSLPLHAGSQFLEPDGWFPNHSPNPENKEAMAACTDAVNRSKVGDIITWPDMLSMQAPGSAGGSARLTSCLLCSCLMQKVGRCCWLAQA